MLRRLRAELAAWREVDRHLKQLYESVGYLEDFRQRLEPLAQIPVVMAWIAAAELRTAPLVSVVMPTRNRAAILPRAIRSVQAQTYPNWELVIVDDGSSDEVGAIVDGFGDDRLKVLRSPGLGPAGARNKGLAEARGELITYLDDDNVMHPGWLKSVAWGFEQRPALNVLYGAIVVDDPERVRTTDEGELPFAYFRPFARDELAELNPTDASALAHRAGLPEAHWDEALTMYADWDMMVRLTANCEPLALPALACFYLTDAPRRLSIDPSLQAEAARIRARAQGR